MRMISSRWELIVQKYIMPLAILVGSIGVLAMFWVTIKDMLGHELRLDILAPLLLLALILAMRSVWRSLHFFDRFAGEVWDEGNALIVRKSGDSTRIPLANIASMEFLREGGQKNCFFYFLLTLRTPSKFGSEIAFIARVDEIYRTMGFLDFDPMQYWSRSSYGDLANRISRARPSAQYQSVL